MEELSPSDIEALAVWKEEAESLLERYGPDLDCHYLQRKIPERILWMIHRIEELEKALKDFYLLK